MGIIRKSFMKPRKHGNCKVEFNGLKFDSKRELARYKMLLLLEQTGEISGLKLQQKYPLVPAVKLDGRMKPAVYYKADFVYLDRFGIGVVEDAKAPHLRKDPYFRLKKHLMKHLHGIEISEV